MEGMSRGLTRPIGAIRRFGGLLMWFEATPKLHLIVGLSPEIRNPQAGHSKRGMKDHIAISNQYVICTKPVDV